MFSFKTARRVIASQQTLLLRRSMTADGYSGIQNVVVVGAGTLGTQVALQSAITGHDVTVLGVSEAPRGPGADFRGAGRSRQWSSAGAGLGGTLLLPEETRGDRRAGGS